MSQDQVEVVTVDRLEVGMVLAEDLCDGSGRQLLLEGSSLRSRHIDALHMWGVTHLKVRRSSKKT